MENLQLFDDISLDLNKVENIFDYPILNNNVKLEEKHKPDNSDKLLEKFESLENLNLKLAPNSKLKSRDILFDYPLISKRLTDEGKKELTYLLLTIN
jgi:hypothetical protein